jgi:hypothetical protein
MKKEHKRYFNRYDISDPDPMGAIHRRARRLGDLDR